MATNLRNQVEAVLASLIGSKRLAVTEERQHGENALVVLESPTLRVRIVRDRGQVFLEFGPAFEPNTWISGDWLIGLLDRTDSHPFVNDKSSVVRIERLEDFLEQNIGQLENLFSPSVFPSTRREVATLQAESARQRFGYTGKGPAV